MMMMMIIIMIHDGEHIGADHDDDSKNVSERVLKGRPGVQE